MLSDISVVLQLSLKKSVCLYLKFELCDWQHEMSCHKTRFVIEHLLDNVTQKLNKLKVSNTVFHLLSGEDEHVRPCEEDCKGGGKDSTQSRALSCTSTGQSTNRSVTIARLVFLSVLQISIASLF